MSYLVFRIIPRFYLVLPTLIQFQRSLTIFTILPSCTQFSAYLVFSCLTSILLKVTIIYLVKPCFTDFDLVQPMLVHFQCFCTNFYRVLPSFTELILDFLRLLTDRFICIDSLRFSMSFIVLTRFHFYEVFDGFESS